MIPASILRDGFVPPEKLRTGRFRRLLIGCEGKPDTGKTEFILSVPGPGVSICLDRGMDPVFDNPNPPTTRRDDWAFKVVQPPMQTAAAQDEFKQYWVNFREEVKKACANPDVRAIAIDGDSDSWELQRLDAFGKLAQVPSHLYTEVNAARRAFYARLWDSGKIIIATNKLKKHYEAVIGPDGRPVLDNAGKPKREWDGTWERQGFEDQEYLWQIQLSHKFNEAKREWGIEILKCKAVPELVGQELWGSDCNFLSLVQNVYPQVPPHEWGF